MIQASAFKVKCEDEFKLLYVLPPGIELVICIGGRGGKKTYEVSKFSAVQATKNKKRVAVMRDEKETIRESILHEIFLRYDTANKYGHFDGMYEKIEGGLRDKETGNMLVFTKGFRASSNEKRSNLKGISDTDIALIEEAEDIRSFNKFSTFKDSIRTEGRLIIVILNTPDLQHWIVKRYFNAQAVIGVDIPGQIREKLIQHFGATEFEKQLDGYFKLVPKDIPGFAAIQTSYLQNKHLPAGVVRDYEAYGDPESATYDLHYYLTAILGFASSGRKGQVLKKVKPIKISEYLKLPFKEIYGLDFGTSSPAGIVGCKFDRNNSYCRQLNYLPLDVKGIAVKLVELGLTKNDLIIADSADAKAIGRLRRGWTQSELSAEEWDRYKDTCLCKGFNIRAVSKGLIEYGIGIMISLNLWLCEESTDAWDEVNNYVYAQNKEGEYTNDPIDDYNHLIDPWRYLCEMRGRLF